MELSPIEARLAHACAWLLLVMSGLAQGAGMPDKTLAAIAQTAETPDATLLGGGVTYEPAYDGSRSSKAGFVPIISYSGDPWFARTTEGILEGGVRTELATGLHLGLQLAYEEGRNTDDSDFLKRHHVATLDSSASFGGFLQYETDIGPAPIDLLARYRKDVDDERGSQFDLSATVGVYGGDNKPLNIEVYAQTTWADAKSLRTFYGQTAAQSAVTGLATYTPSSGFLNNQIGIYVAYNLTPKWLLIANAEEHQLLNAAKNSPLSEVQYNNTVTLGIGYLFGQ
jgi:outer membrane scaffolding protein for murein synthesis (MipA/OmpV family)